MKKLLAACALWCLAGAAALTASAQTPNYAGTWAIDWDRTRHVPEALQNAGELKVVIKQNRKKIRFRFGAEPELTFKLDGSKSKARLRVGRPGEAIVYLEKNDDGTIVLHSERNFQGAQSGIEVIDLLKLIDGGQSLTVSRLIQGSRGEIAARLIFTRER